MQRHGWWSGRAGRLAAMGAVVALLAGGMLVAPLGAADDPPADGARELAERLLSSPFPDPSGARASASLLVGTTSDRMPSPFPVPPGGRLLGSVVRSDGAGLVSATAAIEAPGSAAELRAFFDRALRGLGWTPAPEWQGAPPAAASATAPVETGAYCQSASGPWVWLTITPVQGGSADVRVHLEPRFAGPCAPRPAMPDTGSDLIPSLRIPGQSELVRSGGSDAPLRSTREWWVTSATSVADLEANLAQQLAAAGWTRADGRTDGPLAWSTWRLPRDGDWQGFLWVLEGPGQNRRVVQVRAESAADPATSAPAPTTPRG